MPVIVSRNTLVLQEVLHFSQLAVILLEKSNEKKNLQCANSEPTTLDTGAKFFIKSFGYKIYKNFSCTDDWWFRTFCVPVTNLKQQNKKSIRRKKNLLIVWNYNCNTIYRISTPRFVYTFIDFRYIPLWTAEANCLLIPFETQTQLWQYATKIVLNLVNKVLQILCSQWQRMKCISAIASYLIPCLHYNVRNACSRMHHKIEYINFLPPLTFLHLEERSTTSQSRHTIWHTKYTEI